jgi:tetratricopeptide (TPR) repeat protein
MMRLLKRLPNGDFALESFDDENFPPYAILSHTWTEDEVTYDELLAGTGKHKAGYAKICFCGERGAQDNLQYFWVDTCCINKSIPQELQTAINSMFRWYQRATKCYVYLSDVQVTDESIDIQALRTRWEPAFRQSRWFKRGWTLQELLAPASVEFFSKDGKLLGSRVSLKQEIHEITKVPVNALDGQQPLHEFSVPERMTWAVERTTTYTEDKVYCLLGIFGVFLPLIYGEGETNATLRLREEIQRRQEGRGIESLQGLTGTFSAEHDSINSYHFYSANNFSVLSPLPFPRNEFFTGRDDQLQTLEQFLLSPTHRRMTIYGLGGCGKSALALEAAYRAQAQYARYLVLWVPAISQKSFELAYREIGTNLHVPGIANDDADVMRLVKEALNSDIGRNWLMIVDNADDPGVLMSGTGRNQRSPRLFDYLPHSSSGKILFTSRSRKVAEDLTPGSVLELTDMGQAEARQLLERRITKPVLLNEETAVYKLLELLTYLPLAITQASAFINKTGITVSEYISLLQQADTGAELFDDHVEDPTRYLELDSTVAKTWHISFDHIQSQDPPAAEYLSFMACINNINIPQSLLPPSSSLIQTIKAIGTLKGYAFIVEHQVDMQQSQMEKVFDMHQLVHMALILWLKKRGEWAACVNKVMSRLKKLMPRGGHRNREIWTKYLPHAIHAAALDDVDNVAMAQLLSRVGKCQKTLGQYRAAEETHRHVFSVWEKTLGKENRLTLASMNEVGVALAKQGKYEAAESIYRQALAVRKKVLPKNHPDTLFMNIAYVLSRQGRYGEAEAMYKQTLMVYTKVHGEDHPSTLKSMNNLASIYREQGRWSQAEILQLQVIETRKRTSGPDHPSTLVCMGNLASMYRDQGRWIEAEVLGLQVLETGKRVRGPEHPDTLVDMSNLARTYRKQGRWDEAQELQLQVIEIRKRVLGPEHVYTLGCMLDLASTYWNKGQRDVAEALQVRVLETYERILGPEHPYTLVGMNNLAMTYWGQERLDEAEKLQVRVMDTRKRVLGQKHPATLTSMHVLLKYQERRKEAIKLMGKCARLRKGILGVDHPDSKLSISALKDWKAEVRGYYTVAISRRLVFLLLIFYMLVLVD